MLRAAEYTLRHLDNPSDQVSTLLWAQTFWQIYTGGDIRFAAPPLGLPMNGPALINDRGNGDPPVRELLDTIRTAVERSAMVDDDGPLWWEPP